MQIYKVLNEDVKSFMGLLLTGNNFNVFDVTGIEIQSFIDFNIKGALNKSYLENDEKEKKFVNWSKVQPFVLSIIKGNKQPKKMVINFLLPQKYTDKLYENCSACFLNMKFENGEVVFTTGTSQKEFSLDKSLDILWNEYVLNFFVSKNIPVIKTDI